MLPWSTTVMAFVQSANRSASPAVHDASVATSARIWFVSGLSHTGVDPLAQSPLIGAVTFSFGAMKLVSTVANNFPCRMRNARNGLKSPSAPGSISRFHCAIR